MNMQQLPRDASSKVKQMFKSRWGNEGRIIEVDYSSLEVIMSVVHTKDLKLLELLNKGIDMHCFRLAFKEGMAYETVYNLCHNDTNPNFKEWKQKRNNIKTQSFAAQYGASANGIAYSTGLPLEECQKFIDNEKEMFPDTTAFREVVMEEVKRTAYNSETFSHYDEMTQSTLVYKRGYWTSPSGMRYNFRQYPTWKYIGYRNKRQRVMEFKQTQIANYWCQGEAFFLMAVAFGDILDKLIHNNFYDNKVALITNVHDAVYLDAANEEVGKEAALMVKDCMENAKYTILDVFPNYGILKDVDFPAVAEMGSSMYDKKQIQ